MLDQERDTYEQNKAVWLSRFPGKFVVVKGRELIGVFDTVEQALAEGARHFRLDNFLVRRVEPAQEEIRIPALTLGLLRANSTHSDRSASSDA